MGLFDGIALNELFDNESDYGKKHRFDEITDDLIRRAEEKMGYKLPPSYRELLKFQNGGVISDDLDESWLSAIYGIAPDPKTWDGLEEMFDNWRGEWEYPDIGIPFGETQSAGHDMYYMDFRMTDENEEPRIVRIDNEMDNEVWFVADNLVEFIRMILKNESIDERELKNSIPKPRRLFVTRKKKFASALMPYWLITDISKADFMKQYGLEDDLCEHSETGQPIPRIDASILDTVGTRIRNGETVEITLKDDSCTLFASTMDGSLSNEVGLDDSPVQRKTLTTKGGFAKVSYPVIEQ